MSKAQYIVFQNTDTCTRFCQTEQGKMQLWSPEFPDAYLFDSRLAAKLVAKENKAKVAVAATYGMENEEIIADYSVPAPSPFVQIEATIAKKFGGDAKLLAASYVEPNYYLVAVYLSHDTSIGRHKGVTWMFNPECSDFACGRYHSDKDEDVCVATTLLEYSQRLCEKMEVRNDRMAKV